MVAERIKKIGNVLWRTLVGYTIVWTIFQQGGINLKSKFYWSLLLFILGIIIYWSYAKDIVTFFQEMRNDIKWIKQAVGGKE